jgi:UDP-2,4-diacetamido-2,4,6-trideoxy-beta-L-altropyranose hydrolase
MQKQPRLLIRTDANARMGIGHLMRCLALAQAWRGTGGGVACLTATDSSMLQDRLQSEGVAVNRLSANPGSFNDALQTATVARQVNASWIVLDGYQFDGSYQHALKDNGLKLLFVDDYGHADYYYADLVLNQNSYAHEGLYMNREPYTRLLLGTKYALLRREFLKWRGWNRKISKQARKILVTLGGGDPENVTAKVVEAVGHIKLAGLEVIVVTGSNNPNFAVLQNLIRNDTSDMRLRQNVADMSELLAWSDVAVSAGGSTCWELAYMGLPAVVMVLAENQKDIAADLDRAGVVISLKQHTEATVEYLAGTILRLIEDHKLRQKMSRRGRELVDGQGSARVLQKLLADTLDDLERNSLCV